MRTLSEVIENQAEARDEFVRIMLENENLLFSENTTMNFLRNILEAKENNLSSVEKVEEG